MPDVRASVIIPTKDRWAQVVWMLRALAGQTCTDAFEVVIVDDGSEQSPPEEVRGGDWPMSVRLLQPGRVGIGPAKNRAIAAARGGLLLFVNDDTYPARDFVAHHLAACEDAGDRRYMHLGLTQWRRWSDENLFDVLIAESGMIFFYHTLDPGGVYNFRHAWNCNLSVDAAAVREVGGFNEGLGPFFFEDLELAYRLEQCGWRVRYWPAAVSEHDHRYEPAGYVQREYLLGRMAVWLWRANPSCFEAIYGSGLDDAFVAYCRRFVAEHGRAADAFGETFGQWHLWPVSVLGVERQRRGAIVEVFVQAHRLLKRCTFHRGMLAELDGVAQDD